MEIDAHTVLIVCNQNIEGYGRKGKESNKSLTVASRGCAM